MKLILQNAVSHSTQHVYLYTDKIYKTDEQMAEYPQCNWDLMILLKIKNTIKESINMNVKSLNTGCL